MPGRQVKQSTFDAIVREAIDDFGLTPEEAIADAREQLRKAGITDFSNIVTAVGTEAKDEHEGVVLSSKIQAALENSDRAALVQTLKRLAMSASRSREVAGVAGSNDAVVLVSRALMFAIDGFGENADDAELIQATCQAVAALCGRDEVNRSRFVTDSDVDGVSCLIRLMSILSEDWARAQHNSGLRCDVCSWTSLVGAIAAVQRQNEKVKRRFASGESLERLLQIVDRAGSAIFLSETGDSTDAIMTLFAKACFALRQILSHDDTTTPVSEAFNRARVVSGSSAVTESGLRPLITPHNLPEILHRVALQANNSTDIPSTAKQRLLTECLNTARLCAISDEICSDMTTLGWQNVAVVAMKAHHESEQLVQACLGLMKNLAARDQCKTQLFECFDFVREVARFHIQESAKVAEQYCGLLSSLCLRRPDIAKRSALSGAFGTALESMSIHKKSLSVQRMGCLAVRNACARDQEVRQYMRQSSNAEAVVRSAWKLFPRDCDDVAYAALRDLDVLADDELRRDERYTMPAGFYGTKTKTATSDRCNASVV